LFSINNYLVFIAGTFWGSFLYTLALRYARGDFRENVFQAMVSSSKCPGCGQKINIFFLLPLLGYFFTKRRCPACSQKISWEYPFWEITTGLLSVLVVLEYGYKIYALNILFLVSSAIVITIIDLKTLTISRFFMALFLLFSIYPVLLNESLKYNLYGLLLMFLFFLVILFLFPGSFGGGDLKLASLIGLLLGFKLSLVALEISLISGALGGIAYAFWKKKGLKLKIAFAPFLTLGMLVALFYGEEIILVYYRVVF
jgi:prepilin signal peptidase PulO-like enzyme (type II secretory pathway)